MKDNWEVLWDLKDNIKRNYICIIGISKWEEKEKGTESVFKAIIAENFPNLGREIEIQIHETQISQKGWIQKDWHQDTL